MEWGSMESGKLALVMIRVETSCGAAGLLSITYHERASAQRPTGADGADGACLLGGV